MKKAAVLILLILSLVHTVYAYDDIRASVGDEETKQIRTFLAACADITSFDINDYSYDTLFKYVLYTYDNFRVLTDIEPAASSSGAPGQGGVRLVSSEYIDYIMNTVFHITPEKPPQRALTERGFCYSNGFYLYTGGFKTYFSTEIKELDSIYDLGGDTLLIVFSDIYTEGTAQNYEKSFAVIRRAGNGYSLLRLGMGEEPPEPDDMLAYAPFSYTPPTPVPAQSKAFTVFLPVLLLVCALGLCGTAICVILIVRAKK